MKTIFIEDLNITPISEPLCAAIGNFDGVHLGHQKLIEECKKYGYKSAVLTFYPHPSVFLKKIKNYPLLTPLKMKMDVISSLGIDYLIVFSFNDEIAKMSKERFMDILDMLNIKSVVCGYDFSFGYKGEGHVSDLAARFSFHEVKKYVMEDVRVSSTYIRELLSHGNIREANTLLGRTYAIRGKVNYGSQQGRLIGFPTANMDHSGYFLPKNGVYFVLVHALNKTYFGMCNIGHNPTFNFASETRLEVHIFELDEDLYGEVIEVCFMEHIRDEAKFESIDALVKQLQTDKEKCLSYIGK